MKIYLHYVCTSKFKKCFKVYPVYMPVVYTYLNLMCFFLQTCFVDCLIEQTHPEIRKRDDVDVSVLIVQKVKNV